MSNRSGSSSGVALRTTRTPKVTNRDGGAVRLRLVASTNDDPDPTTPERAYGPASRLLTAAEVSRIPRVPRSTVYELARNRRLSFLKVGRRTLFDQLLRQWIAQQTVRPRR